MQKKQENGSHLLLNAQSKQETWYELKPISSTQETLTTEHITFSEGQVFYKLLLELIPTLQK